MVLQMPLIALSSMSAFLVLQRAVRAAPAAWPSTCGNFSATFECGEEALAHGVVVAVTNRALIRVMDDVPGPSLFEGHLPGPPEPGSGAIPESPSVICQP